MNWDKFYRGGKLFKGWMGYVTNMKYNRHYIDKVECKINVEKSRV